MRVGQMKDRSKYIAERRRPEEWREVTSKMSLWEERGGKKREIAREEHGDTSHLLVWALIRYLFWLCTHVLVYFG